MASGMVGLLASFLVGSTATADYTLGSDVYSGHGKVWINGAFVADGRAGTVQYALDKLSQSQPAFHLYDGTYIVPYTKVVNDINRISPGYKPGALAYTNGQGDVWLTDALFDTGSPTAFMVTLVHEADHRRYPSHTCGEGADVDDNGAYGVDAYYSAMLSHYGNGLDGYMRQFLASNAVAVAHYRLCGNTVARDRVLAAYYNAVFAPVPRTAIPRTGACARTPRGKACDV